MTAWLVTGGAGYIGSHVVSALLEAGFGAVAYDNLSTGKSEFVPDGAQFVEGDILDTAAVTAALETHGCVGVIHCAGYKYAGESVKYPTRTYLQNVSGTATLLEAMSAAGTQRLVFSSSAGVYGTPDAEVVTEATECQPESPYGESKLVAEWLIRDQVIATASSEAPLAATSLRYFNVVGSGPSHIYDVSPHNLFPKVFATLMRGEPARINGDDYSTPDGTCVRDYVHVVDLASAHVEAARALDEGRPLEPVYNLGSGAGTSVREIVDAMREVTGFTTAPLIDPRRPGDPARIVAAGDLATRDLAWKTRFTIEQMVRTAWEAMPHAY